jgi:hypothetical protein
MAGVILLHLAVYYVVTRVNSALPVGAFWDPSTTLDGLIPLVGWTWVLYWAAYPYLTLGAGLVVGTMQKGDFRRAIRVFVAITLIGGAAQLAFPVVAPWPSQSHAMQGTMHEAAWTRPYACLPSMHVAYSVLVAFLGAAVARRTGWRVFHVILAALITLSTLTLKEHYLADTATGVLLGLGAGVWWLRGRRFDPGPAGVKWLSDRPRKAYSMIDEEAFFTEMISRQKGRL